MIYNFELEKQLLAGLIKEPDTLAEISNFIGTSDFYSKQSSLHSTVFRIVKQAIDAGDEVDEVLAIGESEDGGLLAFEMFHHDKLAARIAESPVDKHLVHCGEGVLQVRAAYSTFACREAACLEPDGGSPLPNADLGSFRIGKRPDRKRKQLIHAIAGNRPAFIGISLQFRPSPAQINRKRIGIFPQG